MDRGDGFFREAQGVEAGVAQPQTELVFRLREKTAMALAAGGGDGLLPLLVNVDFWMNRKVDHGLTPQGSGARALPKSGSESR